MGVGAIIKFRTSTLLAQEELLRLSYDLIDAVGSHVTGNFYGVDTGQLYTAIQLDEGRPQCIPEDQPDSYWWHVVVWRSFYGPGYERADPWQFIAIAIWLERRLPDAEVWYGSDEDKYLSPFGPEERKALIDYWAQVGHKPYTESDFKGMPAAAMAPMCCGHRMDFVNPFSPPNSKYRCRACGREAPLQWSDPALFTIL
ncbi:MAG: hypothetical protein ABSH20_21120 [Tepidisphaeraceae bacterium]|jgi:hypothetical protein